MASIRSKTISKNAPKNASEKTYISKLKGNDQIITPLSQLKEVASEKNSYHTIKGEIEGVKHFIYKACVKCGRSVKDGNHCAFCGILCVPKTKLFFKLSIADESGSVHNVSCFDAKIAKFLGIKIGTNEEEIAELLQKIMGIGSIMVRLSVKKEIYDENEYMNCVVSDISK